MSAPGARALPFAAVCAAALAALPGMGPAGLSAILDRHGPEEAWSLVRAGRLTPAHRQSRGGPTSAGAMDWSVAADRSDLSRLADHLAREGIDVTWRGRPDFPAALVGDPQPPGVIFWRGDIGWLERPCVAVVGTRRCTPDGAATAFELGRDLAAAGVCVISGLALGVDGAAHRGTLQAHEEGPAPKMAVPGPVAGPVGVAASGVDVPYPRSHAQLWAQVTARGALLSETPPGRPAQAWRFPARNRIIAALAHMVVVVESHERGGSLITAEAAMARGVDVRVVPGPVRSAASAGSNQLLADGPAIVRHAWDVLDALGFFLSAPRREEPGRVANQAARPAGPRSLAPVEQGVLAVVGWRPTSLNQVVARSGCGVAAVAQALDRLEALCLVRRHGDWWVRAAG
ncbi:MAG: DNA-processing protein DprA [Acidimicrobiales bacterium]